MVFPLPQSIGVSSSITIEELQPTTPGGSPRKVVLMGPSLPKKGGGAKWGGDTRLITAWYPGNGVEATQQNLGPIESPSDFSGEWNRTRMGRLPASYTDESGATRQVVEPMELYNLLDSIRMSGSRLRVTWAARGSAVAGNSLFGSAQPVDWKIVREGRMKALDITPDTEVDIPWSMSFEWVGRGGTQDKAASVRRAEDASTAATAVTDSIAALDDLVDSKISSLTAGVRLSSSLTTLGQLERLAGAPLAAVNAAMNKLRYNVSQLNRAAAIAQKIASTPAEVTGAVLDFARNTTAVANQLVQSTSALPSEMKTVSWKASDLARTARHFGKIEGGMAKTSRAGEDLVAKLRASVVVSGPNAGRAGVRESSTTRAGDVLAIVVCKAGDTPTKMSSKYYGNPDHAAEILHANRLALSTPSFRQGQIVVVPALDATVPSR